MNRLLDLDYRGFLWFNGWAGKWAGLDWLTVFLGHWLPYLIALSLVLAWFMASPQDKARKALFGAFIAFVLARLVLVEVIRKFLPRDRPFLSFSVAQLIAKGAERSFPSGHAAALFAIAATVYFYNKKLGTWLFAAAILVSLARVVGGVHYPSDILVGALVGVLSARLINRFFDRQIEQLSARLSLFSDKILPFTKR
ncbi:MAG: phosphatase PAP2 family protein [Candidatus Doudnabacteria bacterium]|nr:phosphatase PAP2 family protein [Candidatus Doudnabacteria bacterium]